MDKNTWFDDTEAGRIEAGGWEITGELSPNVAPPATHHLLPTPSWNSWSATPNRVGQSSGQNDSSTRSSTRSISIEDRDVTSDDYQSYCVKFFSDQIHTILTHIPAIVDDWVADIRRTHQQTLKNLIVGLDVEWRPNFNRGIENKVAILQLCVDHSCLIFQILHADHVPASLIEFLNNPNFKFVGVGIQGDVEKLLEDYELNVMNTIDLRTLAAKKLKMPKLKSSGLKDLTREVLGKEIDKPRKVTMSRWDTEWLTHDQVQYACVDAFLSFEIGRSLMSGN